MDTQRSTESDEQSRNDGRRLAGRVVIVTGGGRGLGRAMALGLAEAGAHVVVTARERAEFEGVAAEAQEQNAPGDILPLVADVTRAEDGEGVVGEALSRFGRLDGLVNNAGRSMKYVSPDFLSSPERFWEADVAAWKMVIETNVNGPFLRARAAMEGAVWDRTQKRQDS